MSAHSVLPMTHRKGDATSMEVPPVGLPGSNLFPIAQTKQREREEGKKKREREREREGRKKRKGEREEGRERDTIKKHSVSA